MDDSRNNDSLKNDSLKDDWLKDSRIKDGWIKGKYYFGLLLAGGIVIPLVQAEQREDWLTAQASLVIILSLLALMAWVLWKENRPATQLPVEATTYDRATNKVLLCVGIGFAALILNANRKDHWEHGGVARAIGYGALVAGAFFIGGVLLGYLFGLRPADSSQSQSSNSPTPPHTNLEEIADWLTKLFLGAGLVELTRMKGPVEQLAVFMAHGVDAPHHEDPGSPAIAFAIMSFFSASGLLYGYLWTRYQHALKDAAPSSVKNPAPADANKPDPA
jgi:4-amino-4-deoxy-L-arabinose transferase-like glycosyltransferase